MTESTNQKIQFVTAKQLGKMLALNPVFNGNLLCLDPKLAGFIPNVTEHTEHTQQSQQTEQSEQIECNIEGVGVFENLILETLPKEFGTRNRKIFEFARALKSLPRFSDTTPQSLREIVREWHRRALPKIRTKEFEETWIDFLKSWSRVRFPKGEEPMAVMFERAMKLKPPKAVMMLHPDNRRLHILTSVCWLLQKKASDKPFFLSARTAAKYLSISPMQANRYLYLLVQEKILSEVSKGGTETTAREASRYRYISTENIPLNELL